MALDDPWLKEFLKKVDEQTGRLEAKLDTFIKRVENDYVSKTELSPIKIIVFGMAGFVLAAFIAMLVLKVGWK